MRTRRPLGLIAGGLVLVAIDFRTESLDFLPDPLGWLLVALGASILGLRGAGLASLVAAGLSVSDAFLPYRYRLIDPLTLDPVDHCPREVMAGGQLCTERLVFDPVTGWRLAAFAAVAVLGAGAIVLVLSGLRRRATVDGDEPAAKRLSRLRAAIVLVWGVPPVVAIGSALTADPVAYDAIWNDDAEYVALAGLVAMGWLVIELCFWIRRSWAVPTEAVQPSPWAELQVREP